MLLSQKTVLSGNIPNIYSANFYLSYKFNPSKRYLLSCHMVSNAMSHFHKDLDRDGAELLEGVKQMKDEYTPPPDRE